MRVKFFAIPALDPAKSEAELNSFLSTNRILSIDRELTTERRGSFWAVAVTYLDRNASNSGQKEPKKPKIDYKEVLSPEDFAVYAELRNLRQKIAMEEAVPPYMVFTSAQLAEMVQRRLRSLEQMGKITGVGPARLKSHGKIFLEQLNSLQESEPVPRERGG